MSARSSCKSHNIRPKPTRSRELLLLLGKENCWETWVKLLNIDHSESGNMETVDLFTTPFVSSLRLLLALISARTLDARRAESTRPNVKLNGEASENRERKKLIIVKEKKKISNSGISRHQWVFNDYLPSSIEARSAGIFVSSKSLLW